MNMLVEWRVFLPTVAVLAAIAAGASFFLELPFLPTFVVTVAAVLVNGLVATLEDDLPGGFNNPDGTETPVYASRIARVAKWGFAILLVAFAVAFLGAGLTGGDPPEIPMVLGISSACCLLSLALVSRQSWPLWGALVAGFGGLALTVVLR